MRVLVTGAGGFVCRSVVDVLLQHDYEIIALDRHFDDELRLSWDRHIEIIEGDVAKIGDIDFDAVIHGAAVTASPLESDMSPIANLRANLDPAFDLITRLDRATRAIFISSHAVYNATSGAVTEDQLPEPIGMYPVAKRTIESLVNSFREYGLDICTIRLSNVYGPGETVRESRPRLSMVGKMISEALAKKTITVDEPDATRDWTFAPDIGRAVHYLLQAPTLNHSLYNVAAEQVFTTRQVAEIIQRQLPNTKLVNGMHVDELLTRRGYLVSKRLRQDIGFDEWTLFEDGIRQIIRASQAEVEHS